MQIPNPKDWKQSKDKQRKDWREQLEAVFIPDSPELETATSSVVILSSIDAAANPESVPEPVKEETMLTPAESRSQPAEPTSVSISIPGPRLAEYPVPTVPMIDASPPTFRPKRMGDWNPQPKTDTAGSCVPPPVPLSEEQQTYYAWLFLQERYEIILAARRDRRLAFCNSIATLAISILGIIGGGLAIRNGLRAATERDSR